MKISQEDFDAAKVTMKSALSKKKLIKELALSIYDSLKLTDAKYLSDEELGYLLSEALIGLSTKGLPNRTRSKVVKSAICEALGYCAPAVFKKSKPRFPGQNFDTYVQKSTNLQIWNEEIIKERRYVIIQVSEDDKVINLKLINGENLVKLDTTGTLTQKYQARVVDLTSTPTVFSKMDSDAVRPHLDKKNLSEFIVSPAHEPKAGKLLSLNEIGKRLSGLIGFEFKDLGRDQERNRGAIIHAHICKVLGYKTYEDNGQFPDILNQLLEVKLQISPTIDLGLVLPTSEKVLLNIGETEIRHCDVRYVVVIGSLKNGKIKITNFALGIGADFFSQFKRFEGKGINKKLQIPLPRDFFSK